MFHDKYLSSSSFGFFIRRFLSFYYIHNYMEKTMTPLGGANFDPQAFILTSLVDTHKKIFHA
jgi:hypothetical protein